MHLNKEAAGLKERIEWKTKKYHTDLPGSKEKCLWHSSKKKNIKKQRFHQRRVDESDVYGSHIHGSIKKVIMYG